MISTDTHPTSLLFAFKNAWLHRRLVWDLAKRELSARYKASFLGAIWLFLSPMILLGAYTFLFSVVFKARWSAAAVTASGAAHVNFAVVLFVGIMVYALFAEVTSGSTSLVVERANYVKRLVFPLDVLPFVLLCVAVMNLGFALVLWLGISLLLGVAIGPAALALPLILLPLCIASLGIAWFLSATGVFARDLAPGVAMLVMALQLFSPVLFPPSAIAPDYRFLVDLNPLTFFLEAARAALIFNTWPNWLDWAIRLSGSLLIAAGGFWWFQRTRKGFADVL